MCGGSRQLVGARAYLNQWGIVMRVRWTSLFSNMAEIDSAPRLNAVCCDIKLASVRQADVVTNFNPIWPRQKICSSTTKNRLVCGGLKWDYLHTKIFCKSRGSHIIILIILLARAGNSHCMILLILQSVKQINWTEFGIEWSHYSVLGINSVVLFECVTYCSCTHILCFTTGSLSVA